MIHVRVIFFVVAICTLWEFNGISESLYFSLYISLYAHINQDNSALMTFLVVTYFLQLICWK